MDPVSARPQAGHAEDGGMPFYRFHAMDRLASAVENDGLTIYLSARWCKLTLLSSRRAAHPGHAGSTGRRRSSRDDRCRVGGERWPAVVRGYGMGSEFKQVQLGQYAIRAGGVADALADGSACCALNELVALALDNADFGGDICIIGCRKKRSPSSESIRPGSRGYHFRWRRVAAFRSRPSLLRPRVAWRASATAAICATISMHRHP
jgi:hypothetical protein